MDCVGLLTQILPLSTGWLEQLILPNPFSTGFSSLQEDPFKGHEGESQNLCWMWNTRGDQWASRDNQTKHPKSEWQSQPLVLENLGQGGSSALHFPFAFFAPSWCELSTLTGCGTCSKRHMRTATHECLQWVSDPALPQGPCSRLHLTRWLSPTQTHLG